MMKTTSRINRSAALCCGLGLAFVAAAGCDGTTTATYAYDDPYLYASYYPTDLTYSGYYWADDWNTSTFYYYYVGGAVIPIVSDAGTDAAHGASDAGRSFDAGAAADAGSTGTAAPIGIVGAIEALARGQSVCPGQVTVTPRMTASPCTTVTTPVRNGVTIVFNGCQVGNDTINGTFDIASNRTASDTTCSASTTVTLQDTVTMTNLSLTNAKGAMLSIPTATETGTTMFPFGQTPSTIQLTNSGQLQLVTSKGATAVNLAFNGNDTVKLNGSQSFTIDGMSTLQDMVGGTTATVTKTGLTRSGQCCRPTGGSEAINRTGGSQPGQVTWTFGPTCGAVMRNGSSVSLPACVDQ